MQAASQAYKEEMKKPFRNHSYIRVTIGLINQEAQASAFIPDAEHYTYYSNLRWPLDNYEVTELYAACDQDYSTVDGSMYFLPRARADVVLNAGITTEEILGSVLINFPIPFDIKGLTVEFGKAYPVDFAIESDNHTVKISGNASGHFVTEEIFSAATFLRFTPSVMVNGQSRFRIHQLTMGIGIYFDNKKIRSAARKEYISPISEELPTIDFDLTVENKDRAYDVENSKSTVNFLEPGQEISVSYGQELDDDTVEWMQGSTVFLKEWAADDEEMSFSGSDRFDGLNGTYYGGRCREEGVSLYDMAIDVLTDAGIDSRTYWLDPYLRQVLVVNPIPVVTHGEALQIIANAGRCILFQDRNGNIMIKSSFIPDMVAASDNETYFSHAGSVLDKTKKAEYAMAAKNYADLMPTQFFLPRQSSGQLYLNTGYVSEAVAGENGLFERNPKLEVKLEAAFKCFGMTLEFGRNHPAEMVIHSYLNNEPVEDYTVTELSPTTVIYHEFPEFDCLVVEFTKHQALDAWDRDVFLCDEEGDLLLGEEGAFLTEPRFSARGVSEERIGNRVVLNNITFGDRTDYVMEYGHELLKTPKGTQIEKTRELQIIRTFYNSSEEVKELVREKIVLTAADNRYIFYFSSPSYDLSCTITDAREGQTAEIIESSSYYAVVETKGVDGDVEITVSGREYVISQAKVSRQLNPTGKIEKWENPLISEMHHAANMADWIGDYLKADREYDLSYRGEPRLDANDVIFLENRYIPDLLLRVYDHTLNFNGALSGTIKARRIQSG